MDATALYIYTSGTTGLPKAAKVSHYRLMQWSHWFAGMLDTQPIDRMFIACRCITRAAWWPLLRRWSTRCRGDPSALSASDFWRDVRDERCTLFQYIGELCRYLVTHRTNRSRPNTR